MKKKKIKKFVYEGLGFPIILKNVSVIEMHGEMVPDINFNYLQKAVLLSICNKATPLTGNEIGFIRKYFEMTLSEFSEKFGCSHVAALKWERHRNHFARIEPTTDIYIRFFILSRLHCKSNVFKQLYNELNIMQLVKHQKTACDMLTIDVEEEVKMVG